ncbi:guanitoxin biosynthesis heme-dependent pre-guanitoxin N-hydroxylase GntA [Asticcacaulis sp. YBE204]|uniref:guanitoxin biosynthesis heme-dependent pre-guanitoxin N-hydroxylase GntA n=1 Tax=Asticcacaulis sp. YBE204 TaxID=1282363 RepID=UPI0003C3D30C|nr:guanitoxin biosynthesis heme-dependent pre-guanitoxin N-hydroxylase GntA [Asticcacaulis sp. YBE204]ESQ78742.1 hypothetical protein AEYBE204_12210 [Asticcacaulis sp. YBE204]
MFDDGKSISQKAALHAFVLDSAFPCVGARSAAAKDQIEVMEAGSIACPRHDKAIVQALQRFAAQTPRDKMFVSFAIIFDDLSTPDEVWFEEKLWQRLQAFHDLDAVEHDWDSSVSSDPEDAAFSLSLGGKAFYVVGLHPAASRPGRRFSRPALVFNLHNQFENLRASGTYEKFRQTILARDLRSNGSVNPMLTQHGESSEAIQYSGRQVSGEWKCPFHTQHASKGSI